MIEVPDRIENGVSATEPSQQSQSQSQSQSQHHYQRSKTPTPSEVDAASRYIPRAYVEDSEDYTSYDDEEEDQTFSSEHLLLPAPATSNSHGVRTRDRRSSSLISLKTINVTLGKIRTEISDRYHRYNDFIRSHNYNNNKRAAPPIKTDEIYYSVFKEVPGYTPKTEANLGVASLIGSKEFNSLVSTARGAIDTDRPKRIPSGSSGSYFIYDNHGKKIAVFKPKDEEPYGPLSPKWTKWLHRNLFPCFFGRSCLIPNNGYVCEAAASLLDRQLQTFIVPYTDTVALKSPRFFYGSWFKHAVTDKVGSFQTFLNGYVQADEFFHKFPLPDSRRSLFEVGNVNHVYSDAGDDLPPRRHQFEWTPQVLQQFQEELEKLVILDYLMRNTDRGLDNWMIKLEWAVNDGETPRLRIGAIDSGLAFPWKHPNDWRSYPFGWLFLPASIIGQPFSQKTKDHFLPLLLSTEWWRQTARVMKQMFQRDEEFKDRMWKKQWALIKGQAFNVVETLRASDKSPLELARCPQIMVWDDEMEVPNRLPAMEAAINTPMVSIQEGNEDEQGFDNNNRLSSFPGIENQDSDCDDLRSSNSRNRPRRGSSLLQHRYRQLEQQAGGGVGGGCQKDQSDQSNHPVDQADQSSLFNELINRSGESEPGVVNNNVGFGLAEDQAISGGEATRQVVVERFQTVKSRKPVFTWC